jgi:hypothetical protein
LNLPQSGEDFSLWNEFLKNVRPNVKVKFLFSR